MKLELKVMYAIKDLEKEKQFISETAPTGFATSVESEYTLKFDTAQNALFYIEENGLSFTKYQIYPFVYIPANLHVKEDVICSDA